MDSWYIEFCLSIGINKALDDYDFTFKQRVAFDFTQIEFQFVYTILLIFRQVKQSSVCFWEFALIRVECNNSTNNSLAILVNISKLIKCLHSQLMLHQVLNHLKLFLQGIYTVISCQIENVVLVELVSFYYEWSFSVICTIKLLDLIIKNVPLIASRLTWYVQLIHIMFNLVVGLSRYTCLWLLL